MKTDDNTQEVLPTVLISLNKLAEDKLGLSLQPTHHGIHSVLKIVAVSPGGAVEAYNRTCEDEPRLEISSKIVSVNGIRENCSSMVEELMTQQQLLIELLADLDHDADPHKGVDLLVSRRPNRSHTNTTAAKETDDESDGMFSRDFDEESDDGSDIESDTDSEDDDCQCGARERRVNFGELPREALAGYLQAFNPDIDPDAVEHAVGRLTSELQKVLRTRKKNFMQSGCGTPTIEPCEDPGSPCSYRYSFNEEYPVDGSLGLRFHEHEESVHLFGVSCEE